MGIDLALLEILACPSCRSKLTAASGSRTTPGDCKQPPLVVPAAADRVVCTNSKCGLRFPVRDGIPVMLIEEAERVNPEGPHAS